jgi:Na+-transporting methylmalonyl-CoA/oxaloacetate decarboxylase gamma subunit
MKMFQSFLVLSLLVIALSGCSSCPKKGCPVAAQEPVTPPQVVEQVAAPVVQKAAPVVQEPAEEIVEEKVEEKIPAAVLK